MASEVRIGLSKDTLRLLSIAWPISGAGFELSDAKAVIALADKAYPPRGRSASIRIHGRAQGEAVVGLLSNLVSSDKAAERTIGPILKCIKAYLVKHPMDDAPTAASKPHSAEVMREAAAVVRQAIADMLIVVEGSEYGDKLPKGWKPAVKLDWSPERRRSLGGAGGQGLYAEGAISLAMHRRVPAEGKGGGEFAEYASIAKRADIGTFASADWRAAVRALVAHEVAHAVQRAIRLNARRAGMMAARELDKPHGTGWQRIYSLLRKSSVNGWRAAPAVEAPRMEIRPLPATKPAAPHAKPVQLALFAA